MARRTKDEAEKTRACILDAAEQMFYDHGVARTTLEQIARAAKVTRGAVYWHFRDKIEVFDAIMKRVFLPHEEVLNRLADSPHDHPLRALRDACCDSLRMMSKDKRRKRVISIMLLRCEYVAEMAPILKRRRACKDRMLVQTQRMFEQAQKLGQLSPHWTPRGAAISVQAMMGGLITSALEGRKSHDLARIAPACLDMFFRSLERTS